LSSGQNPSLRAVAARERKAETSLAERKLGMRRLLNLIDYLRAW
jgi:hypothetical protein